MSDKWLTEDSIKQVLSDCFRFVDSRKNEAALLCLLTRSDAVIAWEKLKGKVSSDEMFLRAVHDIGIAAARAHISEEHKLTATENRENCKEAAMLAKRLSCLIAQNPNLRPLLNEAVSPVRRAALDRILDGVLYQHLSFTEDAEKKLELESNRDLVNHTVILGDGNSFEDEYSDDERSVHAFRQGMSTSDAYKIVRYWSDRDDLRAELNLFADKAADAAKRNNPIAGRPKSENVDRRLFALDLCNIFSFYCGSPNYDLAADFVYIVFDESVESDTIKKWLKRSRDNSPV